MEGRGRKGKGGLRYIGTKMPATLEKHCIGLPVLDIMVTDNPETSICGLVFYSNIKSQAQLHRLRPVSLPKRRPHRRTCPAKLALS